MQCTQKNKEVPHSCKILNKLWVVVTAPERFWKISIKGKNQKNGIFSEAKLTVTCQSRHLTNEGCCKY